MTRYTAKQRYQKQRVGAELSRRSFLAGLGATGLGAMGLTGCANIGGGRSANLGDRSNLTMLNWPDYIDTDSNDDPYYQGGTLQQMAEAGINVDYRADYIDNGVGFDQIIETSVKASPPLFDIVVPTNWRAAQMIASGWAEQLPIEVIGNHVNIDPAFLTNSWDRGCRYQMPWQAGITGIAYHKGRAGRAINSVNDLFDPSLKGKVGFIGEMREAVGLAMLANGDDPARPTPATARAGLDKIVAAAESGQIGAFTFSDFADKLSTGELDVAMAWSGDAAPLQRTRPDIEFVIPDEGAIRWFDTMVIPAGSQSLAAAGRFMDFVYDPENAASITEWTSYISPVLGVQEVLRKRGGESAELASSSVLFPDDATRNRLYTWGGLDPAIEDELDEVYASLVDGA